MSLPKSSRVLFAGALVTVLATGACSGAKSGSSGSSDPIVIGAISQLSGNSGTFPESTAAAQAVFDEVNASGGINGRKIDYQVVDDAADAAKSSLAARKLVDQSGAVVILGSASTFECLNAPYYSSKGILSMPGVGILPQCFASANVAPVNTGPFLGVGVSLQYAVDTLGKKRPCTIVSKDNGFEEATSAVIKSFEAASGVKVNAQFIPQTDNYQPYILTAMKAGCDALVSINPGPTAVAFEKQLNQVGARKQITSIELSSAYSEDVGKALGSVADGIYANSEFLPYTGTGVDSATLKPYKDLMTKKNVPLNSFGEGGFLGATILVDVLKGIKGDITRQSVTDALRGMQPVTNALTGNPYVFGEGKLHQPNTSSQFVVLKAGVWQPVTTDWTTFKTAS